MALQFLEFDWSEDHDGGLSASALASPAPTHNPALIAELRALLHALENALGPPGALDEGHDWDIDMQLTADNGQTLRLDAPHPPMQRIELSLHLAGGEALRSLLQSSTSA